MKMVRSRALADRHNVDRCSHFLRRSPAGQACALYTVVEWCALGRLERCVVEIADKLGTQIVRAHVVLF